MSHFISKLDISTPVSTVVYNVQYRGSRCRGPDVEGPDVEFQFSDFLGGLLG